MDTYFYREALMKRSLRPIAAFLLALACLSGIAAAQVPSKPATQAVPQDKPVDMKKLLAEIVGDYSFELQGESILLQFTEQDGHLFGAPPGETPEQLNPVQGKPLNFDLTVAESGDYYEIQFARNDKGVIDKCTVIVQGQVLEGTKIIK
jgi:membrane-associated protease RseP (regulator of RpoE activity)